MGMVLTEVATRLRSGAAVDTAWDQTLRHTHLNAIVLAGSRNFSGVFPRLWRAKDSALSTAASRATATATHARSATHAKCGRGRSHSVVDNAGVPCGIRRIQQMNRFQRWRAGISPVQADALAPTIAVCRMGHATGAPMAEILDSCAIGVTEASEARSARDVAMAGPQSSAHMLAVLPIVGIALGYVMGADPFHFLLGSPWGHLALAAGIGAEISGIAMVNRLVARAKEEADEQ